MKALVVSRSDLEGGAARAAMRLGVALNDQGIPARMRVAVKSSDVAWVGGKRGLVNRFGATLRSHSGLIMGRLQKGADANLRSFNRLPSRFHRGLSQGDHDVVNLHWVGGETLSIEEIGRISKPVVWTAHDMWPFCGAEHYAPDGPEARWRHGYAERVRGCDLDRSTFLRKQASWRRPAHVICPSRWLADCVRASTLMQGWPVHSVPNPLDLDVFQPWPKALARQMLGLPADVPLLAFGAMGGSRDPRKGWDLLREALEKVAQTDTVVEAVIFGQSRPASLPDLPLTLHFTGPLHDDITLALLYSAVDIVAVPSRQDNLPQTATEPQACGCPVVAFDVGGLSDAVEHGQTGLLARPFDTDDFAAHLACLLTDSALHARQSAAARSRALELWNTERLTRAYAEIYQSAIDEGADGFRT